MPKLSVASKVIFNEALPPSTCIIRDFNFCPFLLSLSSLATVLRLVTYSSNVAVGTWGHKHFELIFDYLLLL